MGLTNLYPLRPDWKNVKSARDERQFLELS
ncbi:hypothetical protein MiHa_01510 [Microcystis aeruginosa NIES-2522]|nr:hypothetical protein MiHa_01510 [Microcystis aeruginosa NIES-2522]